MIYSLDDVLESILVLISNERSKIRNEKINLINDKDKFKEKCELDLLHHQKDIANWKVNYEKAHNLNKNSEIIDLDIGGTELVTTTKATLTQYPESVLAAMFSGRYELPIHNGRVFIDRNGKGFSLLLQYLRNKKIPYFDNDIDKQYFLDEIDYWNIPDPDIKINKISAFEFDKNYCAETLRLEDNGKIINKHNVQHGIVFCKPGMDEENSYIEIKVNISIPCRGKSHLFIGVVDKSKYKYEHLLSSFWKDSMSSYYWDVWNTKLIKIDENGVQVGTIFGYGCQCEEFGTRFGIRYNQKEKTIEFFKNGANLGVAFRNVPSGMSPALDIWFESGNVEILKYTFPDNNSFL